MNRMPRMCTHQQGLPLRQISQLRLQESVMLQTEVPFCIGAVVKAGQLQSNSKIGGATNNGGGEGERVKMQATLLVH